MVGPVIATIVMTALHLDGLGLTLQQALVPVIALDLYVPMLAPLLLLLLGVERRGNRGL